MSTKIWSSMVDLFPFQYRMKPNPNPYIISYHGKRILLPLLSFLSISQFSHSTPQVFHNPFSENSTIISEVEPPLRNKESMNDRRLLDSMFHHYWDGAAQVDDDDGGREYTYGEITPLGTRQLIHYLNLPDTSTSIDNSSDSDYEQESRDNIKKNHNDKKRRSPRNKKGTKGAKKAKKKALAHVAA